MLRLDKEEIEAVKDETTAAEIRQAMVAKALNLTQTKAAEVRTAHVQFCFEDFLTDARKNERQGLAVRRMTPMAMSRSSEHS